VRYYDLDSANNQLLRVKPLLLALRQERDQVAREQVALNALEASPQAQEPRIIAERDQREAAVRDAVGRMHEIVVRLVEWDVTLRDINTGLIDFPALANGRPIWLCWRLDEADVQFWHRQDEGFANRKPISELPLEGAGPVS
jgi:hypothetical protein